MLVQLSGCQGVYSRFSRQAPLNEKVRRRGPAFPRAARRTDPLSALWPINAGAADPGALPSTPLRGNSRAAGALDAHLARAGASVGPWIAHGLYVYRRFSFFH